MKIQKGIVKYKDRNDIECNYGVTEYGKQYYFLGDEDKPLKNGNRIASTALVEAIDPMVKASNVGLIDDLGNVVIPFENRTIKLINDDIILVEKAQPVTQSVIDAINLKNDPAEATRLVSTPATIKGKLNAQMGPEGRYFFNDQFSEATVCDINGNNLVNDEYYSFIGMANNKLYFSKNTENSEITEYSMLPPEVQSDITPANDTKEIDVSEVEVSKDVVEDALNSEVPQSEDIVSAESAVSTENDSLMEMEHDIDSSYFEDKSEDSSEETFEESVADTEDDFTTSGEVADDSTNDVIATEEETTDDVVVENNEETEVQSDSEEDGLEAENDLVAFANSDTFTEDSESESAAEEDDLGSTDEIDEDELFKDSILKADTIEKEDSVEDTFDEMEVDVPINENIMTDVANSMNSLIKQNKKQRAAISQYKDKLDKLTFTKRNMELKMTKLESKNKLLEEKIREQERIIASQIKELEAIRPQLEGKDELVKLLADAQVLLGQDSYDYNEEEAYYRKAA